MTTEPQLAPTLKKGMGRMLACGAGDAARQANDYYPTPRSVTNALLVRERAAIAAAVAVPGGPISLPVWEPCGRGGAIVQALRSAGFGTVASDIIPDPEHGVEQADLLMERKPRSPAVVTNPPFALAAEMIRHLWIELELGYMALLLKSTFWHAASRTGLFRLCPPARIYAPNWRPDFLGGGAPTMEVIWCVWDRLHEGPATYEILAPPLGGLFEGEV